MISFLPNYHETIVLPLPAEKAYERLLHCTSLEPSVDENIIFNGWVNPDRFRVALGHKRPNNYTSVIIGEIESTSNGSILFVDYKLMASMRMFLIFWTLLILLCSLIVSFQFKNIAYVLGGFLIVGLIYGVAWSNFKLQLKPAREALIGLFSSY